MILTINHDTIKALLLIAPKSDIRYYLQGVCVDVRGDTVTLVATDGHRLLAVPVAADDIQSALEGTHILPREVLDAVKPAKYGKNAAPITITLVQPATYQDEQGRTCKPSIEVTVTGQTTATTKLIDGRFPDWRRVVPATASGVPAQFQPEYLGDWGRVAALLGAKGKGVTAVIHHNGDSGALVTFPTSEAIGVVMPCRVGANNETVQHPGLPAWARQA